jgi:hypothetical protein
VFIRPGKTQLARMPARANWIAIDRVIETIAPLVAA